METRSSSISMSELLYAAPPMKPTAIEVDEPSFRIDQSN